MSLFMDNEAFSQNRARPTFRSLHTSISASQAAAFTERRNLRRNFLSTHISRPVVATENVEGDTGSNEAAQELGSMSINEHDEHVENFENMLRHMMAVGGHAAGIFPVGDDMDDMDEDVDDSLDTEDNHLPIPGIAMADGSVLHERGQRRGMKEDVYDEEGVRLPDPVKHQRLLGGGSSRRIVGQSRFSQSMRRNGKQYILYHKFQ